MSMQVSSAKKVLRILLENGYAAYFVGGFVRDHLLGMPTEDIDITTSATPELVKALFPTAKPTGIKFGTVTVFMDNFTYEVTTFRKEGKYINHRHPESVDYSLSLEEDLKRRDFTINAFAMDLEGKIIDLFGGEKDLKKGIIRAIGDPLERFEEDALRILRAFRFVSKLDFDIEPDTFAATMAKRTLLKRIANERILSELQKIIVYPHAPKAIRLLHQAAIGEILPGLGKGLEVLSEREDYQLDLPEFFALCFYLDKGEIPAAWRFSNKQKTLVKTLINLITVTSEDTFNVMILYANGIDICLKANRVNRVLDHHNDQEKHLVKMWQEMPIHSTCELAFKGEDILKETQLTDARIIGSIIDEITYKVITGELPNEKARLREYLENHLNSQGLKA